MYLWSCVFEQFEISFSYIYYTTYTTSDLKFEINMSGNDEFIDIMTSRLVFFIVVVFIIVFFHKLN